MTISQLLALATEKLNSHGLNSPHLESGLLLSHILKKPREYLLAHDEKKLSPSQNQAFRDLISRRLKGEPIAYLTGHKEFYGLDFNVNKSVLIPRPETELLVEEALKLVTHNSQPVTLVDVGTGSGCIIIALAKILNFKFNISNFQLLATDISQKALAIAQQNAKLHRVDKNIKFLKGNLLEPIIKNPKFAIRNSQFVILANLPYLTPSQVKKSSIKYEPCSALNGGPDGLKYYRRLFQQTKKLRVMSYKLRDIYVLCEIDPRQTTKIKQPIKQHFPQTKLQIKKDLAGLNRLAIIKIKTNQSLALSSR